MGFHESHPENFQAFLPNIFLECFLGIALILSSFSLLNSGKFFMPQTHLNSKPILRLCHFPCESGHRIPAFLSDNA